MYFKKKSFINHFFLNFSCDSLTIYDGDSIIAQSIIDSHDYYYDDYDNSYDYYGSSVPTSFISSTNSVLIHFESDESINRPGFQLEYNQYIA